MSDRQWLDLTSASSIIGVTISTTANLTLLFLLCSRPSKSLGSYKYLMIAFCIFSLFYTGIETFLRPLFHIYDNTIFVIQRKRFLYSTTLARALSSTYCGCYAMSFTLFAVHFVYRYYAACRPQYLRFFDGIYFFLWVFGAVVIAGSWGAAAFILYPETDRTRQSVLHVIQESYGLDPEWCGNVPYSYFFWENGIEYLNPRNVIGILHHSAVMTLSFGTVFYCGYKTQQTIKEHSSVISDKTRELHNQLFKALLVQTFIPVVLLYLPTTLIFVTPFAGINIGAFGNITIITVHLYPGVDPLILLFLIKDFRKTLKKILCGKSKSGQVDRTTTNMSSVGRASSGK